MRKGGHREEFHCLQAVELRVSGAWRWGTRLPEMSETFYCMDLAFGV